MLIVQDVVYRYTIRLRRGGCLLFVDGVVFMVEDVVYRYTIRLRLNEHTTVVTRLIDNAVSNTQSRLPQCTLYRSRLSMNGGAAIHDTTMVHGRMTRPYVILQSLFM